MQRTTHNAIVDRLRSDDSEASQLLDELIGLRLRSLIDLAQARGLLPDDSDTRLHANILASLRIELRLSTEFPKLKQLTRQELQYYLLAISARLLGLGVPDIQIPRPPTHNSKAGDGDNNGYVVRIWSRPLCEVGGDVYDVRHDSHGLWVLLADATGHSRTAYVVACGVALLWAACLSDSRADIPPDDLVARMDRELSTCLPFGEFVEAAIARASASGVLQIVGAGDVQFLYLKSPDVQSTILSVSGPWLGLAGTINIPRECVDVDLTASGSEIVLATDGLYDQPDEKRVRLGRGDLLSTLSKIDVGTTLYEATKHAYLVATAQSRRQHDDTTILSLRRL